MRIDPQVYNNQVLKQEYKTKTYQHSHDAPGGEPPVKVDAEPSVGTSLSTTTMGTHQWLFQQKLNSITQNGVIVDWYISNYYNVHVITHLCNMTSKAEIYSKEEFFVTILLYHDNFTKIKTKILNMKFCSKKHLKNLDSSQKNFKKGQKLHKHLQILQR